MATSDPDKILPSMLTSALVLGAFAVLAASLLAWTEELTRPYILENERRQLLERLHELVPAAAHDNDMFHDTITVRDTELLGTAEEITVYRARMAGHPVAVILDCVAPDGYNGPIHLLVGIWANGAVAGVRVLAHRETPGLGDWIETDRSDWVHAFANRSLADPPPERWTVKRDGGDFDQFTGATITPRAVTKAVKNALLYFETHRDELFREPQTHVRQTGARNPA
ncbi:MAG TPA: electron transport complex subunit RsxG [Gammaproteobacteria bacterium]|nr:electron transport complex subunit RsxG [Gammaproteobacteria bacterium]